MMTDQLPPLRTILEQNNVQFEGDKIKLPEGTTHIKLDIGLSFDAPHSQNWIDNDREGNLVVFGFEANPFWVNYIKSEVKDKNFKDYHTYTIPLKYEHLYKKFFIVPVAVGNVREPQYMDFYVPSYSHGCCSLLPPRENILGKLDDQFKVPVYSLKDFFELLPLDKIDYIDYVKVDVQGYDIEVLKSAGQYLADKVVYVTAEPEVNQYHNSEGNSVPAMVSYMQSLGFVHINHHNTNDPTFLNRKFFDKKDVYIWQKY